MAEPRTATRIRFTADTIEGLRDQLHRAFAEMAERFETDRLITRGVQFIPVRGPNTVAGAKPGLFYLREYDYLAEKVLTNPSPAFRGLTIILESDYNSGKHARYVNASAHTLDADGVVRAYGLHD